jgi:DNA-binding beta-propeller fold protein YncE
MTLTGIRSFVDKRLIRMILGLRRILGATIVQKLSVMFVVAIGFAFMPVQDLHSEEKTQAAAKPITLIHRYKLPASIKGHFDHFTVDAEGKRLFGTAVEDKVIVVFDLRKGVMTDTIKGIDEPRGVLYRPDLKQLYVSDGGGALRIFDSTTFQPIKTLKVLVDADPIVYDASTKRLFVVNGGEKAKHPYSNITVFDATAGVQVGDIQLDGIEIEGMAVEKTGPRLFANNRDKNQIDILDRKKLNRIATWPVTKSKGNTVMALDEATNRMFVACHGGHLVVFDMNTGKELQTLAIGEGSDDIDFDPATKRIYVSGGGGEGSIDIYREVDADHYESLGRFVSAPGAATARLVPELGEYIVLAPAQKTKRAEVLIFQVSQNP